MWFIGVEVELETSAPPPKKNPGSAPVCSLFTVQLEAAEQKCALSSSSRKGQIMHFQIVLALKET